MSGTAFALAAAGFGQHSIGVDIDSDEMIVSLYTLSANEWGLAMSGEDARAETARFVAHIVASYVAHHSVSAGDLGRLIGMVHGALGQLGKTEEPEPQEPAVPIRRSVQRDVVICLDCGFRGRMLRRHLRQAHGLEPAAYRARWNLPPNHPITAPSYSEHRASVAKELGLGRRPKQAAHYRRA
jgi:predicted transcriptional regulator